MNTERQRMAQMLTASNDEFIHMFDIKIDEVPDHKPVVAVQVQENYWNWMRVVGGIGFAIGILFCVWFIWLLMAAFL